MKANGRPAKYYIQDCSYIERHLNKRLDERKMSKKKTWIWPQKNQDRKKRYCIDVYNVAHQPNSVKATISQTDRDPSAINTGDHRKKYGVLTAATILINLI